MTTIRFTVPGAPVAQPRQRHRAVVGARGKVYAQNYTPKEHPVQAYKYMIQLNAISVYDGKPLRGPLSLQIRFFFQPPKASVAEKQKWAWKITKPDIDNLVKAVKDALNGVLWEDDAQVVILSAFKNYGSQAVGMAARTQISVEEIA